MRELERLLRCTILVVMLEAIAIIMLAVAAHVSQQPTKIMDAVSSGRWCYAWLDDEGCIWYSHMEDGILLMDDEIEKALR